HQLPWHELAGARHRAGVVAQVALVLAVAILPDERFIVAEPSGRFFPVPEGTLPPPGLDAVKRAVARASVLTIDRVEARPVVRRDPFDGSWRALDAQADVRRPHVVLLARLGAFPAEAGIERVVRREEP